MTESTRIPLLVGRKAARSDRLRGFGSGWLVSIALHAALLWAASVWVSRHPAREDVVAEEPVARLDLRIAQPGIERALERLPKVPPIARDVLPSFDAGDLVAIEDARASDDAYFADDAAASGAVVDSAASARDAFSTPAPPGAVGVGSMAVRLPPRRGAGSGLGADRPGNPGGGKTGAGGGHAAGALGAPDLVSAPPPDYPEDARRRRQEGDVRCLLHVDERGCVVGVDVLDSSGWPALDEAARTGLMRWRFRPASIGGLACACSVDHVVTFRLVAVHSRS